MTMGNIYSTEMSKVITNLRFPLMLGVVLIHNVLIEPEKAASEGLSLLSFVINLFSRGITAPCVPLFFFCSGYLFFLKYGKSFDVAGYRRQVKKRLHTLLVPYVFWNTLVLSLFAFMHKFLPSLVNPEFNNVYKYSVWEFLRSYWDFPGGQPVCYQFWFLRDLMMVVLFSPVVYAMVKYGHRFFVAAIVVLYLYDVSMFPFQMAFTFFSLGAWFAINNYDFVAWAKKLSFVALPAFLTLACVYSTKTDGGGQNGIVTLTGAVAFILLASKYKGIDENLTDSGFFVYAFHGLPILLLSRLLVRFFRPSDTVTWLVCYVLCFAFIILLSVSSYLFLKKMFPKITSVITGGR